MSVLINNNGTLNPIAGNGIQNTFTGTEAEVTAAMTAGEITEGTVVYITDDNGVGVNAEDVAYDNTESGLIATDVQNAIDETKAKFDEVESSLSTESKKIIVLEKTNYAYILDNASATINANLVYAASQLSNYADSKGWATMMGGLEINASDGHVVGNYWCDKYGAMGGIITALSQTPTAYSYFVSNGVCTMSQLSN